MHSVARVIIHATPAAIWQVLADVERWPRWTPTVLDVQPLSNHGLHVGSRYRIVQPKLRPAVYEVTECVPHQAFTWVQKTPGATMIADHRINACDGDGAEVELTFSTEGLLGGLLGMKYAKLVSEYVRTEARSLKAHCESPQVAAALA
jgi:uncharacterized protein YndB with AHSA1/START domain